MTNLQNSGQQNSVRTLWLRAESRADEGRAAVVPGDLRPILDAGIPVVVEESPRRAIPIEEYAAAGAQIAAEGSWVEAPADAIIVGLKELPDSPAELRHDHVFFGHAFKGQPGAAAVLSRFRAGGGRLFDLEYLADPDSGQRLAAFGYWAGYVGAALGVLALRGRLEAPLQPTTAADLAARLAAPADGVPSDGFVLGRSGRSGTGATAALNDAGVRALGWDLADGGKLDRTALVASPLLVNCVLSTTPIPPYLTAEDLAAGVGALRMFVDVTADIGSPLHLFPPLDRPTTWDSPVAPGTDDIAVEVIGIDNLPSLVPADASATFSADVHPHLIDLACGRLDAWANAAHLFDERLTAPAH